MSKGLKLHQVDKYIDWNWYKKELKSTQVLLKSNEQNDKKNREKYIKKITLIEKKIKTVFTADDINAFEKVSRYGLIPRRSSRIQSNKAKADLNEMLIMENDSEILELFESWLGERIHPNILQYKKRMYHLNFE